MYANAAGRILQNAPNLVSLVLSIDSCRLTGVDWLRFFNSRRPSSSRFKRWQCPGHRDHSSGAGQSHAAVGAARRL